MSGPYQGRDLSNCGVGRLRVAINCGVLSVLIIPVVLVGFYCTILTLSMRAFGPRISAYAFWTTTDIHTYIPTDIPREISIEHPSVGLASLAQLHNPQFDIAYLTYTIVTTKIVKKCGLCREKCVSSPRRHPFRRIHLPMVTVSLFYSKLLFL